MGEQTETVKIQQEKWALLSTTVQAQVVIVATAIIAAVESGTSAGWVNAVVAIVGSVFTVLGRFAATGGLTFSKPVQSRVNQVEVEIDIPEPVKARRARQKDATDMGEQ